MASNSDASRQHGDHLEVEVTGATSTQWQGPLAGGHRVKEENLQDDLELHLTTPHTRIPLPSMQPSSSHPPVAASASYTYGRSPQLSMQPSSSLPPVAAAGSNQADRDDPDWEENRRRCLIVSHPLYPEMVAMHAACLRVGTPVDQLPGVEAQLVKGPEVAEKYRALRGQITPPSPEEQADLDDFMRQYPATLGSFANTLDHHVHTAVSEAMMWCWQMEQELYNLTGARPEPGYGATWSDDEVDYDTSFADEAMDAHNFGPLKPTDSERALMERVRDELKHELKQGYKSKIEDIREEIMRKKRAGKLPEDATIILKNWWEAHATWPYPTEEEKAILTMQTGLKLKQINNWFINQRKRNWQHSNPMLPTGQATDPKGKARKSW